jgi:Ca2+-binding protein (EF-Hand superfamily)
MSSVSMGSTSSQGSSKPTKQKPAEQKQKVSSKQLELELKAIFDAVDSNHSGKISARELSSALSNFDNTRFQDSTIILMIRLFSSSSDLSSGPLKSLNFDQFVQLWKYLSVYKKLFVLADTNRSGDVSFGEFQKVLTQIGYKLNVDLVLNLFQKFANKSSGVSYDSGISVGKLKFDAFIELLVYLRKLTDVFKKYDTDLSGVATISFSDFLFEVSNLS